MKVSVIVPCYNQAQYLNEALQSVMDQTYVNWECIIINDGSTDNTKDIAKQWYNKDERFKYYFNSNEGLPSARNFGIERSSGVFILPLDADDYISSNYLEVCVNEFETKNLKLVYGKVEMFGNKTGEWKFKGYSYSDLLVSNMIHCTAMFKKVDWVLVGGYDQSMVNGLEDWEFWVHLLDKNDRVSKVKTITFFYRVKQVSMISLMDKEKEIEVKKYVFNKHASKYFDVFSELSDEHNKLRQNLTNICYLTKKLIKLLLGVKK